MLLATIMESVRDIFEYEIPMKGLSVDGIRKAHELVTRLRNEFIENKGLQNLLLNLGLNLGYERENGQYCDSFFNIYDQCFNRTRAIIHLTFLEHAIKLVTQPPLV